MSGARPRARSRGFVREGVAAMSLSCSCGGEYDWYYDPPSDFTVLSTKRARKCCSCGTRLPVGTTVLKFRRWRSPTDDIEERIHGEEVALAPWVMCEPCGGLFLALNELGYCIPIDEEPMRELVREHNEMRGEWPR